MAFICGIWLSGMRARILRSALVPLCNGQLGLLAQYATAIVLGTMLTLLIEWPSLRLRDRLFPAKGNLHLLIDSPPDASVSRDEHARNINPLGGIATAN